jgi:hypothetical protein
VGVGVFFLSLFFADWITISQEFLARCVIELLDAGWYIPMMMIEDSHNISFEILLTAIGVLELSSVFSRFIIIDIVRVYTYK